MPNNLTTRVMKENTKIKRNNTIIYSDSANVTGLDFYDNKKVFHLPIEIAKTFPNLLIISSIYCPIKNILKENFEGLVMLKKLWFRSNQIEEIKSGTFNGLIAITNIDLRKDYEIKF
jgi:hypothetical protein